MTLKRGHDLPEARRVVGEVPVVSSSGITGYHDEAKSQAPGVVTGRYGTLGEVFYIDRDYWPLNTALYVVDFKGNDPRFVAYFLRNALRNYQSDKAAVPGVNRNVLHELEVQTTDPATQERIAELLSRYDDSIANNLRRIELLATAAQTLYREWFVRLRFPGYEHTRLANGVPTGWERRPLKRCVTFRSGGTPSKRRDDHWDGTIPWASSGELTTTRLYDTTLHISEEGAKAGSSIVKAGTILVVVRGMSLAKECRISVAARDVAFNQDIKALHCNPEIDRHFLACALLEARPYLRERATEASHGTKKLESTVLEELSILVPTEILQVAFRDAVEPFERLRDKLHAAVDRLVAARDLLLPRLLSGHINV
jgi:type I restriction enzyme S subunit